ncbi:MAG: ABC transporter ATP-binding protein [Chloroflexi bacterium]|nr:ABC transporter ATP-binding protein [Chloroflexota bacterium]
MIGPGTIDNAQDAEGKPLLELHGITKLFGSTLANDHISLTIERAEIHALLGENGAGKSTLMNLLYGLYRPDSGTIDVGGRRVEINSPRDAASLGIQMVHQHFMLGLPFTVAENVVLGNEPHRLRFLLDSKKAADQVRALSERYGLQVDPNARIESLSVGERQRVEILKALYREAEILILDEPTAVLTPPETEQLFAVMRRLRADNKSVIFISHKLREVLSIADRITVLRRGQLISTCAAKQATERELIEMMVGHLVDWQPTEASPGVGPCLLEVRNLQFTDRRARVEIVKNVSFEIRAGEILGIAGVEGNGQRELVEILCGLRPASGGTLTLDQKNLIHASPREIMEAGVACIHEDRQAIGIIGDFTLAENLILGKHCYRPFARNQMLDGKAIEEHAQTLVQTFDVRPGTTELKAKYLSGGNQQKLVAGRELSSNRVKLLIAAQPSRGLDVSATMFIYQKLREMRNKGTAVLLISADLDELKLLSDRIAVIFRGEIVACKPSLEFTDTELGALMLRGRPAADACVGTQCIR